MSQNVAADAAPLVALLRKRPRGATIADVRNAALDLGDGGAVWERFGEPPSLLGESAALESARQDIAEWAARGITTLSILDRAYPERVRSVWEAPPVLFARGAPSSDDLGVSVVGSRDASAQGLRFAAEAARALAGEGLTVISGLAKGIDAAAHTAALDAGARTVAFVATGLDHVYPAQHRDLQERIVSSGGAVLSQYLPEATARKHTFLQRNALMSGYGLATLVVEAGEHSGARAQASRAIEHGRPVILTQQVVDSTQWAQRLLDHPRVAVVQTPERVLALIEHLQAQKQEVAHALRVLVST